MNIINLPIDAIIPYERNPRRNDGAVDAVAASIREFGFKVPIVVDADNVIVTGHTRHKAAKRLGLTECPCIRADDLTPEQVRAYRLADNKVAELAEWDFDLLAGELEGLEDLLGLDWEIDRDTPPPEVDDDDYKGDFESESGIKRGDMFALGNHLLLCGDCTMPDSANRLMEDSKGKILFTSPPYCDQREYDNAEVSIEKITGFITAFRKYTDYQCVNLGIVRRCGEILNYWDAYIDKAKDAGYKLLAWNVWDKMKCGGVGMLSAFIPIRHEFIFVFGTEMYELNRTIEKKKENIRNDIRNTTRKKDGTMKRTQVTGTFHRYKKMESVVNLLSENGKIRGAHPATMPVRLPGAYINAMTQPGDIVIDPFCGSGTTIIAAEQCGRACRAMEISPKYCRVIIDRWEQFTGRKAERIS